MKLSVVQAIAEHGHAVAIYIHLVADADRHAVRIERQLHGAVVVLASVQSLAQAVVGFIQALDLPLHLLVVLQNRIQLARYVYSRPGEAFHSLGLLLDALDALFRDSHLLRLLFDTRELLGAGE